MEKSDRNNLLVLLSLIVGLIIFGFVIFSTGIKEVINILFRFSILKFLVILLLFVFGLVLWTYKWDLILRTDKYNLKFKKLFIFRIIDYAIGYVIPTGMFGGETTRAYLTHKEGVHLHTAISTIVIDRALELTINIILGLFCIVYLLANNILSHDLIIFFTIFLFILSFLLIFFYYMFMNKKGFFTAILKALRLNHFSLIKKVEKQIEKIEQYIINFFNQHRLKFFYALFITAVGWFIFLLQAYLIFWFLGYKVSFTLVFLVMVLSGFVTTLPMPAYIGVLEGGIAGIFLLLGLPASAGVAYSLILRGRDIILVIFGFIFLSRFGITLTKKYLKDDIVKKIDKK